MTTTNAKDIGPMVTVTVDVTAEDIAHGYPGNCMYCPVARATRRATGETIEVGIDGPWIQNYPMTWHRPCPDAVLRFTCDFDARRPVFPFSFTLDLLATDVHPGLPRSTGEVARG